MIDRKVDYLRFIASSSEALVCGVSKFDLDCSVFQKFLEDSQR